MSSYSNYYIKLNMNSEHTEGGDDELSIRVPIESDNVFTTCPICGLEHQVDLAVVAGENFEFFGTSIFCGKCTDLYRQMGQPDINAILKVYGNGERELHLDLWEPENSEKPGLVEYFRENYVGILSECGNREEAAEAKAIYELVKSKPLFASKNEIQEHFAFAFQCVGGEIEKYYDQETVRLINLTVRPD